MAGLKACLGTLALISAACAGGAPPASSSIGEALPLGPLTLKVSRVETVSLTETFSRTGEGLGLAVFVELAMPEPSSAVASEIAALREEANRIAQTISNMRSTRRNFDDSELTEQLVEAVERLEELEEKAYMREPRARLFTRSIQVVEQSGEDHRTAGYVTEETYEMQMRFRSGRPEEPFMMLAASREAAGYREGGSPQDWVLLFRLPPDAANLTLLIDNPSRQEGQPRSYAVSLAAR